MFVVDQLKRILGIAEIERKLKAMSALSDKIDAVKSAAKTTEARVTAHEQALKQVAADLQTQIDALKANGTVSDDDLAGLQSVADDLAAFDPDAA